MELALRRRWGLAAAGLLLLLGFIPMSMLWLLYRAESRGLRGLDTYWSATLGDALVLPLFAYALAATALDAPRLRRPDRLLVAASAAMAGIAGAYSQYRWLRNPGIEPNWTIPQAGYFNVAGWYHAVFLVFAATYLTGLAAAALIALRRSDPAVAARRVRSPAFPATMALFPLFIVLLGLDRRSGEWLGIWAESLLIVLGETLLLAFACRGVRRDVLRAAALVVLPLGGMASSALLLEQRFTPLDVTVVAIATALGVASVSLLANSSRAVLIFGVLSAALVGAGGALVVGALVVEPLRYPIAIAAGALASIVQVELVQLWRTRSSQLRGVAGVAIAQLCVGAVVLLTWQLQQWEPDAVLQALIGFAVIVGLAPAHARMKRLMDAVISAEDSRASGQVLTSVKYAAYTWAAALLVALLAVLLFMADLAGFASSASTGSWHSGPYWAAGAFLLAHASVQLDPSRSRRLVLAVAANVLLATAAIVGIAVWLGEGAPGAINGWVLSAALLAGLVLGAFVFEGVLANIAYLQLQPMRLRETIAALSGATVAAGAMTWAAIFVQSPSHGGGGLLAAGALLIAGGAVAITAPWLTSRCLPGADPSGGLVPAKPLAGTLQDAFLGTVLAVSVGWLPSLFVSGVPDGGLAVAHALIYVGVMWHAYSYVMRNNAEHAARFANADPVRNDPGLHARVARALSRHVRRQNRLALILPPVIAGFILAQINPYNLGDSKWLLGGPLPDLE